MMKLHDTVQFYNVVYIYDYYSINVIVEAESDSRAMDQALDILIDDLGLGLRDYNDCEVFELY